MHRLVAMFLLVALAAAAADLSAVAGERGAIKRFKSFPVATYDENGNFSDDELLESTTPPPEDIYVDGSWPDKKMLLITFDRLVAGEMKADSYFILYRAVEMKNQVHWDAEMAASGGLKCNYTKVTGASPQKKTAATKRFASPC